MSSDLLTEDASRGAAVAAAGTALSRLTGFARLAAFAFALGVTENTLADVYNVANITPNIIFELVVGGVLSSVLLRVYVEIRTKQDQQEAFRFISRLTAMALLTLVAVCLILVLFAGPLFAIYGNRPKDQLVAGTLILQLVIPQLIFYGLSTISTAVLDAHRRFGVSKFAPVINNLIVIAAFGGFALFIPEAARDTQSISTGGLVLLGLGTTAGVVALGLIPWLFMRRVGYRFQWSGLIDPRFRRLLRLSSWMFVYVAMNQAGLAVITRLAAEVRGGVTAYQFAFVFFQLPHGLLAVSIATVAFTNLAESAVHDDHERFATSLGASLRAVAFFTLPAIAGYVALSLPIVRVLLERGVTTAESTELIAAVLRVWAPGIFFFSTWYILLRGFYALGDTRTPAWINAAAVVLNLVLAMALYDSLDTPGAKISLLAAAHGASYVLATALGGVIMIQRGGRSILAGYFMPVIKMVVAAVATGVGAALVVKGLGESGPVIALAVAVGLLIYLSCSKVLGVKERRWITAALHRR